MNTWFISDLHLAPEETRITAGFLHFLSLPQAGDELYILGDFFNYWLGDDIQDDYADTIKAALKALHDRHIKLYFMHGNRDFLIGETFCQQTHSTLLPDPSVIKLNGQPVVLMHGDSLCSKDTAYMEFRAMARSPQWQQQFLSQSIAARTVFAEQARAASQQGNAMKDEVIMDVSQADVDAALQDFKSLKLIHGHTHRPAIHDWQLNGQAMQRIVLGDWYHHGWYLKVHNQQFDLIEFELPTEA